MQQSVAKALSEAEEVVLATFQGSRFRVLGFGLRV